MTWLDVSGFRKASYSYLLIETLAWMDSVRTYLKDPSFEDMMWLGGVNDVRFKAGSLLNLGCLCYFFNLMRYFTQFPVYKRTNLIEEIDR